MAAREFPSQWSMQRIKQSDNQDWNVEYFGGFPYLKRYVKRSEQKTTQRATLNCSADFKVSIMKEGDVVILNPTDYEKQTIKGSILPIVQALLLGMEEGDKCEAIAPAYLGDLDGENVDVYVEIELKTVHRFTGVTLIFPKTD